MIGVVEVEEQIPAVLSGAELSRERSCGRDAGGDFVDADTESMEHVKEDIQGWENGSRLESLDPARAEREALFQRFSRHTLLLPYLLIPGEHSCCGHALDIGGIVPER